MGEYRGLDNCYADVIELDHFPKGFTKSDLRDMIKASFNAMLNSKKVLKQPPTGVQPSKFGLKWAQVSDAIIAFHQPIKHHLYKGVGLRLQRLDSDIAEKVMLHFAQKNIAILPLHDSFLMHDGYESSLKKSCGMLLKMLQVKRLKLIVRHEKQYLI